MKSFFRSLVGSGGKPDAIALENLARGRELGQQGQVEAALAAYAEALARAPDQASGWEEYGMLLVRAGQKDAALQSFGRALALQPRSYTALFGRAALLQGQRDWRGSLDSYDRAIAVNPGDAVAHYNRGNVLRELARPEEALAAFDRAIACNPAFARAFANRGVTLQALGRPAEALASYDLALGIDANDPGTHNNRGVLLQKAGKPAAARESYERALAIHPGYAEAHFNRGTLLHELEDLDAAQSSYERALSLNPTYTEALVNLGNLLGEQGRLQEAIACYRRAIEQDPGLGESHYNLALTALKLGDYTTGWASHEWRWQAKSGPIYRERREFREPLWLGRESLAGKAILLYSEQGLGDSLQFCRYASLVAALGARVILEVPVPLVRILKTLQGVAEVIVTGAPRAPVDYRCPLMSLPLALGTTLATVPAAIPYLYSSAADVAAWQERLGPRVKPRVGLTWSGNRQGGKGYTLRHFELAALLPYLPPDLAYFCLQTEILAVDRATLEQHPEVRRFTTEIRDFADTAALVDCLDLVISVDTSVTHLAGARARPTWVILPWDGDWRWLTDRSDSPWYPTVRLYRQASKGDWPEVFARLRADLLLEFSRR